MRSGAITIGGQLVEPGQAIQLELFLARLPTQTPLSLPLEVISGRKDGPTMWLSAAIHGDELNGVEIIRRILDQVSAGTLAGVLIAAPVVNVFGFVHQSRYLPDRRDLNRCFPGSPKGSLASRLADLFMREVVDRCTHGIDLHTGGQHRSNLPQVRGNLDDPETRRCAEAFGAPIMIHAKAPAKTLREAAVKRGKTILLYEAGEPLRFNEEAIAHGVKGVLSVMRELGMIRGRGAKQRSAEARKRRWVRAPRSGILNVNVQLGQTVRRREVLGVVRDAFGEEACTVLSPVSGMVIGHTGNPLVNQGDGIIHIARDVTFPPSER